MRTLVAALAGLAVVTSSAAAFAQNTDDTRTQFVNFDEFLVEGEIVAPKLQRHVVVDDVDFEPVHDLERSFMPELRGSVDSPVLEE
jgi:hypothetical protein